MTDSERQAIAVRIANERVRESGLEFNLHGAGPRLGADGRVYVPCTLTVLPKDIDETHESDRRAP